ncbi:lysozyme-like domain-containing protein, partial [Gaertneriomyces semiglobifer]
ALTNCQKSIIQQLTNTFENSQKNFAFDYCDDIHDGRGYTVGVVGFTTSTKDALDVIQTYTESSNYQNEFDDSLPRLLELNSTLSGETSGLKGFCRAWYKASSNPTFRAIQIAKADELYYNPSQTFADELALELPTSRGQMYDAAVQMGIESDPDSLPSMLKRVPRTSDMSEEEWLTAFLAERERTL